MDSIIRALAVYAVLLLLFRVAGKRTLSDMGTFDFILLIIISEATQQAMMNGDESMTNSLVVVLTLVGSSILLSVVKQRWPRAERLLDGMPLVIVENGRPLQERMDKARVDEQDIMEAARLLHGLERMDQIKYAVLERRGQISIIPRTE